MASAGAANVSSREVLTQGNTKSRSFHAGQHVPVVAGSANLDVAFNGDDGRNAREG